ncbi:MFS transporter [Pseudomonas sp. MAFF 302046]|uniref:MFS transporter n=1 Tax=Pseudomonas morbosilactucae TaxID=2938197 RepID=A0ABT0JMW8_9PSED|nr:MFS transporter [Pseudomonas morbosilactucae]MCK9816945.1 MFS transporter [Pseudomonas morbosilactucae]
MKSLLSLLKAAPAREPDPELDPRLFRRLRLQTLLSMSLSYALFYVCRLSFNVVKPALVSQDILSPSELGMIGSALFFTYAVGKLVNGFLADHANVRRFMMLGLALSALVNACMGLTTNAVILTLAWGINGWAQSMGVGPCVVSLARWYGDRERGTYYGFWSIAHNLGEALTYVAVAAVVVTWGWQYGYWLATAMGLLGIVLVFFFMADSPESRGFAPVNSKPQIDTQAAASSVASIQWLLLKSPALWLLALASCLMYVGRYAVNSWGVFFLENAKHYDTLSASTLISVASICGIAGTGLSGLISDRFFRRSPAWLGDCFRCHECGGAGVVSLWAGRALLAGRVGHGGIRHFPGSAVVFPGRLDGGGHRRQGRGRGSPGHDRHRQLHRRGGRRDADRGDHRTRHDPVRHRRQALRLQHPVPVVGGGGHRLGADDLPVVPGGPAPSEAAATAGAAA